MGCSARNSLTSKVRYARVFDRSVSSTLERREAVLAGLDPLSFLLTMAVILFTMGIGTFIAGIVVLINRAAGRQVRAITQQTARLAQKGITDEVSGLVGNAADLLEAVHQLLKTTAGIAVFLSILGGLLVAAACWIAIQLYPVWP